MQMHGSTLKIAAAVTVVAAIACTSEPVKWSDVRYSPAAAAGTARPAGDGPVTGPAADLTSVAIPDSARCPSSVRLARAGKSFFAVWWSVRNDSSASLLSSRSDDGAAWARPVAADTSDASARGCARPSPSIEADVATGYVHVAYFAEPSTGPGVFYVHSMDRGESFHARVAMVFGARPANTDVTAEGARVAVAYEDPNSSRPQIFVALSTSLGHIFETKLPVSGESAAAVDPVVTLRGTKLEVGWSEIEPADTTRRRQAARTGIWK